MATYKVEWEIELEENSPKEAAIEALNIQQDPFSEAVAYTVTEVSSGIKTEIDLLTEG